MVTTITHRCRQLLVEARDEIGKLDNNDCNESDTTKYPGVLGINVNQCVQDLIKDLGNSSLVNTLMPLVFAHVVPLLGDARVSNIILCFLYSYICLANDFVYMYL